MTFEIGADSRWSERSGWYERRGYSSCWNRSGYLRTVSYLEVHFRLRTASNLFFIYSALKLSKNQHV